MSQKLDCDKLRKNRDQMIELGQEFKDGLNQDKPDVLELRRKKNNIEILLKESDVVSFKIEFPEGKIMTIDIGGKTGHQLYSELNENKFVMSWLAKELIEKRTDELKEGNLRTKEKCNIFIISLKDLGFSEQTAYELVIEKAKEKGFSLLPLVVGPHFRLDYKNQKDGENVLLFSESHNSKFPITMYSVYNNNGEKWITERATNVSSDVLLAFGRKY